jgi:hypothetical protein
MKTFSIFALLMSLLMGCATTSTIPKRMEERRAAYDALPPEQRSLVDQGQIKIGMTSDAVYIAWGPPSQILNSESGAGTSTTWIYSGTGWQQRGYWTYHNYGYVYGGRYGYVHPLPAYDYDYIPYRYTAAEVVFEKGVVKSWKHVTPPPN